MVQVVRSWKKRPGNGRADAQLYGRMIVAVRPYGRSAVNLAGSTARIRPFGCIHMIISDKAYAKM